jgi:hypothetical protein
MEAIHFGGYVIMAPSVSTGDGGRNVAGEYLVAEPLDYFHFAEAPVWGLRVGVTARSRNKSCCLGREIDVAHPSKRKGSGFELEVVKVLQAMSLAKPATDPDSGIFAASMA